MKLLVFLPILLAACLDDPSNCGNPPARPVLLSAQPDNYREGRVTISAEDYHQFFQYVHRAETWAECMVGP